MKRLSLLLVLCGCCTVLSAQSEAYKRLATYAAHIGYFNQLCPQEKVYLHLDNTAYFQGETIWYAANVVGQSKVLYVELLSPTGVVLKQQKLKVVDGRCHGSFVLIDSDVKEAVKKRGAIGYPSGYYQIRAYTRSMLNFDDACIFSRVIPVYQAPEKDGYYVDPVMAQYSYHETNRPEVKKSEKPDKLNLTFYPEGGHLLSGVPCRIAFKATDKHGHGVDIDALTDEQGHTLPIGLQHNGMGSFVYTTAKGKDKLTATCGGKRYTFHLPEAEMVGCALQLHPVSTDTLTADLTLVGSLADSLLAYTVTSQGKLCAFDTVPCRQPAHSIHITTAKMPTGVAQFTLYGASGAVYAQRLFFVDNGCPTVPVTVTADKEAYRPFDEVKLHLQAATTDSATFSLAVRDAADYGTAYRDDIRTYMLLSSELKGLIEEPEWYFREGEKPTPNPSQEKAHPQPFPKGRDVSADTEVLSFGEDLGETARALDLLMMVQGWTRYDWRMMAGVEPFAVRHYTEDGLVVDGWAFSRILEKPLANVKVGISLYSPDRQFKQKTTVTTDSLGYWSVGVEDFEGEWDLFLQTKQQAAGKEKRTTRVRLERSSAPGLHAYDPVDTYLPSYAWEPTETDIAVIEEEEDTFLLPQDAYLLGEVEIEGRRMYVDYCTFKAYDAAKDTELTLDAGEYTYKVVDYLREKGYDVDLNDGRIRDIMTLYLVTRDKRLYYEHSFESGCQLDMERVESVIVYDNRKDFMYNPVVRQHYDLGQMWVMAEKYHGGPYVVEIRLRAKDDYRRFTNNSRQTSFKGYDTPVEFYAPTYPDGPVQGDKDYRRTVYWNPEVTTDANGVANVSFYNNGYSRSLTVSAEGLTADGVPILNQ